MYDNLYQTDYYQQIHSLFKREIVIANMSETNETFESMFERRLSRFKTMSWAEITYLEEEEEEAEQELERVNALRILDANRRELFAKGEYELEEGEIFE